MKYSFQLRTTFPVKPLVVFYAWLDSDTHSKMTGAEAVCSNKVGDTFTAWDEYITGKNIMFIPNKEITQKWRTTDFKETDDDSLITIELVETDEGCEFILNHDNIPYGQADYKDGWVEHYFTPMKAFFEEYKL